MLICSAIMCCVYDSFGTRLHDIKKIDTLLTFLETAHPSAVSKSRDYFSRKLKRVMSTKGYFCKQAAVPINALSPTDKVAHIIVKCKEPHTIAEELISPAIW